MSIIVCTNIHASCDACGTRPDAINITFSHYGSNANLCDECGIKLIKAVAGVLAVQSPKLKKKIDLFFKEQSK